MSEGSSVIAFAWSSHRSNRGGKGTAIDVKLFSAKERLRRFVRDCKEGMTDRRLALRCNSFNEIRFKIGKGKLVNWFPPSSRAVRVEGI